MKKVLSVMLSIGRGGLENVFVQHSLLFKNIGAQSAVICIKDSACEKAFKEQAFSDIFTIPNAHIYNPLNWIRLAYYINAFAPDILCLHGNRAICFCTSPLIRFLIGAHVKIVATTHNNRNRLFYRLDAMLAITQALKQQLIDKWQIPADKIFLCPNAVEEPKTNTKFKPHMPVTIGFLGRLEPVKGVDILIKSCLILKQRGVPFHLIIAGDGNYRTVYEQAATELSEQIRFIGWINDKAAFFNQIDVMCFPSRSEGLPVSLIESCAFKKPIVVTTCEGMLEVLSHKNCGLSVEKENPLALANALQEMIEDIQQLKDYSDKSYETFMQFYHINNQKDALRQLLERNL